MQANIFAESRAALRGLNDVDCRLTGDGWRKPFNMRGLVITGLGSTENNDDNYGKPIGINAPL